LLADPVPDYSFRYNTNRRFLGERKLPEHIREKEIEFFPSYPKSVADFGERRVNDVPREPVAHNVPLFVRAERADSGKLVAMSLRS
jgi:hypothetical protein